MEWIDSRKRLPEIGQEVLIHIQGYGIHGNYWTHYETALLIRPPSDKRRKVFAQPISVRYNSEMEINRDPWIWTGVIYWMPLPAPPPKIEEGIYRKLAGYD